MVLDALKFILHRGKFQGMDKRRGIGEAAYSNRMIETEAEENGETRKVSVVRLTRFRKYPQLHFFQRNPLTLYVMPRGFFFSGIILLGTVPTLLSAVR